MVKKKTIDDAVKKAKRKAKKINVKANKKLTEAKKAAKDVYKRAKNGRVYKLVNGRPRFVSKVEAQKNGFGKEEKKSES